jgi:tripartite-type tricarboxylate transporter receptor subunit TctC
MLMQPKLEKILGQPLIIENRAGAGGTIGTAIAAKSNSDGYTLVLGTTSTLAINESLYPKLGYDIARDLAPIVLLAKGPFVLMSTPGLPVASLKELIAYAKANPGKLSYSSSGTGGGTHLAGELFNSLAGTKMQHIPYKAAAAAATRRCGAQPPSRAKRSGQSSDDNIHHLRPLMAAWAARQGGGVTRRRSDGA